MPYVDAFVIPIAKSKMAAYTKMARKAAKIWKELGALEYRECVGDDLKASFGMPFPKMAMIKPSETVLFSWIVYKNKAHRNKVNKLVMKDPRIAEMCDPKNSPFDVNRMAYGGFKMIVEA